MRAGCFGSEVVGGMSCFREVDVVLLVKELDAVIVV